MATSSQTASTATQVTPEYPLHHAARSGDVDKVRELLKHGKYKANECNDDNDTPLHVAALNGEVGVALCLIDEFGCDPNAVGYNGESVLHSACQGGNASLVKTLVSKYKADTNARNNDNDTPLHVAALNGEVSVTVALCLIDEFGCNPNAVGYNGESVLHSACKGGNASLVKTLVSKYKADTNARNNQNDTPLHVAVLNGEVSVSVALCLIGCNPNAVGYNGESVLHLACQGGNVTLVKTLVSKYKADTNARNNENDTPLHVAAYKGKVKVALCLIDEIGCDTNLLDTAGNSLLHYACLGGNVSLVKTLVSKYKADTNARNNNNDTPLHVAALSGKVSVALCLIDEFGCNPNTVGYNGQSVLHSACKGGYASLVKTLVSKYKADTNAGDNQNNTPLHVAALKGEVSVALCLIDEFGCDTNLIDTAGNSLLHYACHGGNVSLVKTLVSKYKADTNARNNQNSTPLHVAAYTGKVEVALCLIEEFDCDPNVKGYVGKSLLHSACEGGNVILVKTLVSKYKADTNARNNENSTPLHVAALKGEVSVALCLIDEFGCDTNLIDTAGNSLLHYACHGGNVSLVKTLVSKYKADTNARNNQNSTPLHVAALKGEVSVALCLIDEFGCDTNLIDTAGNSLLHDACQGGNISLVKTLVSKYKADTNARDIQNSTPLHVAAISGEVGVALCLIDEFGCNPNAVGYNGRSVLHYACHGGNVSLVKTLVSKYKADTNARNNQNNTPLHAAASTGKLEVALCLIDEFGCDTNLIDTSGNSLLHYACRGGNVSLVKTLVSKYKADTNARNNQNSTPLHVAALNGEVGVALCLIDEFGCNPNTVGYNGQSVLHYTCQGGNVSLVKTLVSKYKADINACDNQNNTPLHVAAYTGKVEVTLCLINEFGCNPNVKGLDDQSLLHFACNNAESNLVSALTSTSLCLFLSDKYGDTPLHLCARSGELNCMKALLSANAPLLLRNNDGETAADLATGEAKHFLTQYVIDNHEKLQIDYISIMEHAKMRYSGEHHIIRIFVLGNSGAGKSSLLESLKRESSIESFRKVSESSVPLHTAGIIPCTYHSKHYGRVLLYDFAGDPEYYSSHAAILENLASSRKGSNIFLIVVDLRSATVESSLHYWASFIQQQKFSERNLSLGVVGSHHDVATSEAVHENTKIIHQFCQSFGSEFSLLSSSFVSINCRKPRSRGIDTLQKLISSHARDSEYYRMSEGPSVLLGLLEKDFNEVTACPIHTILSHIKESGVCLPDTAKTLHPIISELHEIGVLLLLGYHTKGDYHVVLKSSKLTNEVHKLLFSKDAISSLIKLFKLPKNVSVAGIIPETDLSRILPSYITKECLLALQYCQEIKHKDVGAFPSLSESDSLEQSFLFFPALCSLNSSDISWDTPAHFSYGMGWLARCTESHHSFPPRFLHVLLLRLVFRFTLSVPAEIQSPAVSPDHQRYCTMWKTGVQWSMEEGPGMDCRVELVNGNKEVVVLIKGTQDNNDNCATIFSQIVSCVMVAKAEFCHSIKPKFFLLDSTSGEDYLSDDNLFPMSVVKRALTSFDKKKVMLSISSKGRMDCSKLLCMRKLTLWASLFPMDFTSVLLLLQDIVRDLHTLGLHLGVPSGVLEAIEVDFPTNTTRRREELVKAWMKSSLDPPSWWRLVQALKRIEHSVLAANIEKENSKLSASL